MESSTPSSPSVQSRVQDIEETCILTMLNSTFAKLKLSPKAKEKEPKNQDEEVADMTPNIAIAPWRLTSELLASGSDPEFLHDTLTARLEDINAEIDANEAKRKEAIGAQGPKEGPLSPAVGRPPSFSRPKLADGSKALAKELDVVNETGKKLAKLKPEAKNVTLQIEYLRRYIMLQSPAGRNRADSVISVPETEAEYVEVENKEAEIGEEEEVPVEMTRGTLLNW